MFLWKMTWDAFVHIENVVQKAVLVELVGGEVYITLFYIYRECEIAD